MKSFKLPSNLFAIMHFVQQEAVADLLFVEPRSSSGEGSVLELCPDIL